MVAKPAVRIEPRPQGGRRAALLGAASALIGAGAAHAAAPGALPQDPTVAGGAATFARSGQTLTVNQSTNRTVIDWRSFDIGAGAQTTFNQPGASAIAVNRVNAGTDPTHIDGALRANGQVWVLNPNGVMFGKGAVVNVAGLVASTANIDAGRFMAGDNRLSFTGADRGFVTNDGAITVADNGLAAFVAPSVRNSGAIHARVGKVTLAAGTTFTLDLAGDRLVELGLGSGHAVVDQSGAIVDEGGVVTLSARSAGQVVDSVINMSGVVSTASARLAGGQIVLEGDTAGVTGAADASGTSGGRITLAANTLTVGPQATLRADSVANGDGGTITAIAAAHGDYAGAYSARGGPSGGSGGKIETSGKVVHIADGISVDTRAPAGAMGAWTIDPDTLTVVASGAGAISGGVNDENATIGAGTVVQALNTSNVSLQANTSISVNAAIDSSAQGNSNTLTFKDQNADGQLTVNLNAPITLGSHQHLTGVANVVHLTDSGLLQNAIDVASTGGASVFVGSGSYESGVTINKSNLALIGTPGVSEIDVNPPVGGQAIGLGIGGGTSNVTISGFRIVGEITGSYVDYDFAAAGNGSSRGIAVVQGATGFHISNNIIQNVRTGLLVDGRNVSGASITGNVIDNTKTAVFMQYTAGEGIDISGNSQGTFGNEWGENFHVNGVYDGTNLVTRPGLGATSPVQAALLAGKAANNGWSVQDQAYDTSNRTSVLVTTTGSDSNQGSPKTPLASIQNAINAVVSGGEIDVANGTYVSTPSTGYININKPLALIGQSQAGVIIDARNGQQYGLRVTAPNNVTLRNLTVWGVTASGGYGVKIETINGLNVSNLTSQGAFKSEFDLNSVTNGVLDHLTANGLPVGGGTITGGNGISISDSQNVTLTNSSTVNNGWGGLALYQTNAGAGAGLLQEKNITVAASNSFSESVPVYAEDTSTINDFGTLNIGGFPFIVRKLVSATDIVTVFQPTQQAAIDYAASISSFTPWVQGYGSGVIGNNVFTVGTSTGGQALSLTNAYNAATSGATINVLGGTYTLTSQFNIAKSLSLIGAGVGNTTITSTSTGYGINVTADNVHLSGFTFNAPTAHNNATYGIKVTPDTNQAADRLLGFNIDHVAINGGWRTGLDLNGALGASIDHVSVSNVLNGNGIALTDSANVAITNTTTSNDAWGGLALYQTNTFYNQQLSGVSADATNSFNDVIPVYAEVQSTTQNIGSVSLAGFNYVVKSPNVANDVYTWFQKTQQAAIDFSTNAALSNNNLNLSTATVQGYGGSGVAGNNIFTVGVGSNHATMSIIAALRGAQGGATVNVNNGTYVIPGGGGSYLLIDKSLSLIGQSQDGVIIDARNADTYAVRVAGTSASPISNVTLRNLTFYGVPTGTGYGVKIEGVNGLTLANITSQGAAKSEFDLNGVVGGTLDHLTANGAPVAGGANTGGNGISISDSQNLTLTNTSTLNNGWGGLALYQTNRTNGFAYQVNNITVDATNSFAEANPVYLEDQSATNDYGTLNIAGFNYLVKAPGDPTDVYTWFQKTQQGAIDMAAAQSLSTGTVQSYSGSGSAGDNNYTVGVSTGGQALSIKAALDAAQTGAVVTVNNGTYVIPGGGTSYLGITKSLTLKGVSRTGTIIDARGATAYGLRVQADNVTLRDFTLLGSQVTGGYGVKVEPMNLTDPNARVSNFAIRNVTIDGATKNTLDLNGALNATIDNVTAKNAVAGNGIALIDSANVAITNSTTANNAWGGLRIEEKNASFNQQTNAITVAASNSFGEAAPVYLEDDSATRDFGTINIAGFGYAVKAPSSPADVYTWLQRTQQGAIDFAAAQSTTTGTVQSYSGSGFGDNSYIVGFSTGGQALSIQAAVNSARAGGIINIASGTYAQNVIANSRLNFNFGAATTLGGFTLQAGAAGSGLSGGLSATSIALGAPVSLLGDLALNTSAAGGAITTGAIDASTPGGQALSLNAGGGQITLGALGAGTRLGALQLSAGRANLGGGVTAASIALNGPATLLSSVALDTSATNGTITMGAIDGATAGGQALTLNAGGGQVTLGALGAGTRLGVLQLTAGRANLGGNITAASIGLSAPATLLSGLTLDTSAAGGAIAAGTIDGASAGGQALTLNAGSGQITLGALGSGTRLGALQLTAGRANLGGNITAASIGLSGPATLLTSLAFDTSAAGGAITTGAIDASAAGGQALTLNAGGGIISLGSLGASARLGAVQASSSTTLTGDTYNAASLAFGSDLVLTAGLTTVNTAPTAGNITVAGSLLGSADGAQSLVLAAGSGTGGANGDISLQNVGAKAVRLNNLTVSGDDFGAQTVDLAGDFTSNLTGNQVFSSHTLNTGGNAHSNVGGNASGPINAGKSVNFAVGGDLSGAIAGSDISLDTHSMTNVAVNASQSASVNTQSMADSTVAASQEVNVKTDTMTNSTLSSNQAVNLDAGAVKGSNLAAPRVSAKVDTFNGSVKASDSASITGGDISGSFSGGSFKIAGTGAVNANVAATSLSVDTPKGTVTGSWQSLDTGSSGRGVSVNNQPVNVQGSGVSANQIVVQNFTLPAGSAVTTTGEIILPQGQMLSVLSPGGASGPPKLIQVQTVQQLGSLLSEGYTAIVIDLSGHEKASNDDKPIKVGQN